MRNKRSFLNLLNRSALAILSFFILAEFAGSSPQADKNVVFKVIDGDTLLVDCQGRKESVRLIGIDTPESRVTRKAQKDAEKNKEDIKNIIKAGRAATRFVQTLVKPGDEVMIEFDVQVRDKYGRLLGYVYLPDGKMLNEEILRAGYANLLTYPPNIKYVDRFLKAYREARENKRGLWGSASLKPPDKKLTLSRAQSR